MPTGAYKSLRRAVLTLTTAVILMQTTCVMPTFPTVIPNDWWGGTAAIVPGFVAPTWGSWYVPDFTNPSYYNSDYYNPGYYNPGYYGY